MLSKKNRGKSEQVDTFIGQDTCVNGGVEFCGALIVEGEIRGNVSAKPQCEAVLTVSQSAVIEGNVCAPHVSLDGTVVGDIHGTGTVELHENAKVTGNIYYDRLEMSMGAAVNGQLIHEAPPTMSVDSADINKKAKSKKEPVGAIPNLD